MTLIVCFLLFITFSPIDVTQRTNDRDLSRFDWHLQHCCDHEADLFIILFVNYFIINFLLWNSIVLKPMKLAAVFLHELSHATAAWLTGGRVGQIEVYEDEGGITHYSGGIKALIIPAGYLGCAFWGGMLVGMSGSRFGASLAAGLFMSVLILTLAYSPNAVVVGISIFFTAITAVFLWLDWYIMEFTFIQYVTLVRDKKRIVRNGPG